MSYRRERYECTQHTQIIKCVQNDVKALKPRQIKLHVLDVSVNGHDMNIRIKCGCCARGHLEETRWALKLRSVGRAYQSFTLLHILLSE